MPKIDSDPRPGDFGLDFDYAVWTPNTHVSLSNVRWDSTYRDIVWFNSNAERLAYLNRKNFSLYIENLTYCAQGTPIRVDIPFSVVNQFNYLYAHNRKGVGGAEHYFFYFITSVQYVAPNTTEITVQLDVWQTYYKEMNFGRCYVERGHIGIAAENAWENYGQKYLTCPEGLDMGGEYVIGQVWEEKIASVWREDTVDVGNFDVIVASTVDLELPFGTEDDPQLHTASGSRAEGLPNGCSLYAMTAGNFETLAQSLAYVPWVSQGIISIMAIPKGTINFESLPTPKITTATTSTPDAKDKKHRVTRPGAEIYPLPKGFGKAGVDNNKNIVLAKNFRRQDVIPERYRHLHKFRTSPYMMLEVTCFTGTPLMVRPESVKDNNLEVTQWSHVVPPSPRIMFTINRHNQALPGDGENNYWSEHFDAMTGITDFPTFALTNNGYLNYMASNAHTIAYQYSSAEWSQQKALRGASTAYAQAAASRQQAQTATDMTNAFENRRTQYNANNALLSSGVHTAAGAIGNLMGGNLGGAASTALMGGFDMGMQYGSTLENQRMMNEQRSAMTAMNNSYGQYMADTNLEMAKFAANGDYANTIAAINAKTQDARMIQPTISGQMGGDVFNLVTDAWRIVCRQKVLDIGSMTRIGEFWLRYGYAMNVALVPPDNLQVMSKFTYWQMSETYIYAPACPEGFRQAIRGIFEKGVTVWSDPNYIGATDYADNEILDDIRI